MHKGPVVKRTIRWVIPPPTPLNLLLLLLMGIFGIVVWCIPVSIGSAGYLAGAIVGFWAIIIFIKTTQYHRGWQIWYQAFVLLPPIALVALSFFVSSWPRKLPVVGTWAMVYGQWLSRTQWVPEIWQGIIHPNTLGLFSAPVLPVQIGGAIALYRRQRQKTRKVNAQLGWMALVSLPVTVILLVLSQSRNGLLSLGAALLWMLWWTLPWLWRAPSIALLTIVIAKAPEIVTGLEQIGIGSAGTLITRKEIWSYVLLIIQGFPLTGVGFRALRYRLPEFFPPSIYPLFKGNMHFNAHNAYLQIAADLGLPGLVVFLAILGVSFWMWYRVWLLREKIEAKWGIPQEIILGIGGGLVAQVTFGIFESSSIGIFILGWTLIGLITGLYIAFDNV